MKTCKICGKEKNFDDFHKCCGISDGYRNECKECRKYQLKQYYIKNKDKLDQQHLFYNQNNEEIIKQKRAKYCQNYQSLNRDKIKRYNNQYYNCNKEHIQARNKKYYDQNPEYHKKYIRKYYKRNKERINKNGAKYAYDRKHRDINFRIITNLRSRLSTAVKNNQKSGSAVRDLGCTIEFLKTYLESKFTKDMTWENYGRKEGIRCWEIDHIFPLSKCDLSNREEFLKVNHYTNLQPLWFEDNNWKRDKIL